jgi:endonuclease/exonuclease/phosphatase (EEP) superfamily protein YafD
LTNRRNRQLAMLAKELDLAKHPEPVVVLGDFNLTSGTAMWRSFTGYTALRDAPGSAPATWHSALGPFGITIDHILARGASLAPLTRLPIPGSDHAGLRSTVTIAAP